MRLRLAVILGIALLSTRVSAETISVDGWLASIPTGTSAAARTLGQELPVGSVLSTDTFTYSGINGPGLVTPLVGPEMLLVKSNEEGTFVIGQSAWDITASQVFTLAEGEALLGSAFFYNGDPTGQDSVWLRVFDANNLMIATLFAGETGSGAVPTRTINYRTATPWFDWSWIAPTDGVYTLMVGVTTRPDNTFASVIGVDNVRQTPEPAGLALCAAMIVAFSLWRVIGIHTPRG